MLGSGFFTALTKLPQVSLEIVLLRNSKAQLSRGFTVHLIKLNTITLQWVLKMKNLLKYYLDVHLLSITDCTGLHVYIN